MKCRVGLKMFRIILLTSVLASALADDNIAVACKKFMATRGIDCAKEAFMKTTTFGQGPQTDDLKECYPLQNMSEPCDFNLCVAKKRGFLSADGTVDRKTLTEIIEKDNENNPQIVSDIKDKCINGDLSKYEDGKRCDLLKLQFCVDTQILKSINSWNDEGQCKGVKTLMEECVQSLD